MRHALILTLALSLNACAPENKPAPVDTRDARIAELESQVKSLESKLNDREATWGSSCERTISNGQTSAGEAEILQMHVGSNPRELCEVFRGGCEAESISGVRHLDYDHLDGANGGDVICLDHAPGDRTVCISLYDITER